MADYYRDLIRLLLDAGFEFKRPGRGDHEIWWNPRTGVRVTGGSKAQFSRYGERHPEGGGPSKGILKNLHTLAVSPPYRRRLAF